MTAWYLGVQREGVDRLMETIAHCVTKQLKLSANMVVELSRYFRGWRTWPNGRVPIRTYVAATGTAPEGLPMSIIAAILSEGYLHAQR